MRTPWTIAIVAAVVVTVAVLMARGGDSPDRRDETAYGAAGAPALPPADVEFLTRAAESSSSQIELAQLAQRTSEQPGVDALAQRIEQDLEQVNDRLEDLTDRRDVDFPNDAVGLPGPTETQRATHERLDKLEGPAFDRAWIDQTVTDHRNAVSLYQRAADSTDTDVKAYAESGLPVLKARLTEAEELQRELKAPASTR